MPNPTPSFYETIALILTSISIIATIIGWSITYKQQRKLFHLNQKNDLHKIKISKNLERINKIGDWVRQAEIILYKFEKFDFDIENKEIIKLFEKWDELFETEIQHVAWELDEQTKIHCPTDATLDSMVNDYWEGVHNWVKKNDKDSYVDHYIYIRIKLEILTNELLELPIPYGGNPYKW